MSGLLASATERWDDLEGRILDLHRLLDTGNRRSLALLHAAPVETGPTLFALLFGADEQWRPVLGALFRTPAAAPQRNPTWAPVRLRIATEDVRLQCLPWQLTASHGHLLGDAGWVLATTQVTDPALDIATTSCPASTALVHRSNCRRATSPATVLILAPASAVDGGLFDSTHEAAVRDVLAKTWPTGREPGYARVVRTREELGAGLRELRPGEAEIAR